MLDTYEKHSSRKLIATVLSVLVIAGLVIFTDQVRAKDAPKAAVKTAISHPPVMVDPPVNTSGFKDGTYSAAGSYYVPNNKETIQVNLTLASGVITDISLQNSMTDRDSAYYQEQFTAGYKQLVIGKKISGLKINTIAGASDTTQSFNEALRQIAEQAQS